MAYKADVPDVALVTEDRFQSPTEIDWYVGNLLEEDRILTEALAAEGLTSERVGWSRASVNWASYRCALVRSTWDYFERYAELFPRDWYEHSPRELICGDPYGELSRFWSEEVNA